MRSFFSRVGLIFIVASGGSASVVAQDLPKLTTKVAFSNLTFQRPVAFADPNQGDGLLFVVEQPGRIYSFPKVRDTKDKQLFLDIKPRVNSQGNEEGLLGLAFHPKYKDNGKFYVYYSWKNPKNERYSVVSEFSRSKDDPRKADAESEKRVWVSAKDPFENHNGGCIEFGPDGLLYISLGDSGGGGDPLKTGQDPRDWFGSILRIDVDHPADGKAYGIPKDNPRARDPKKFANWAPEVYCIGLRNVWKFTFDKETGTLWAGEVGQNLWEIVHIIKNGGNYGWSVAEGFHPFDARAKIDRASPITKPIAEYPHNLGQEGNRKDIGKSITGGYVYRGKKLPGLSGAYVYGDYDSGRIWAVREKDGKATSGGEIIDIAKSRKINIAAFGEDSDGELYILGFDGKVHELTSE